MPIPNQSLMPRAAARLTICGRGSGAGGCRSRWPACSPGPPEVLATTQRVQRLCLQTKPPTPRSRHMSSWASLSARTSGHLVQKMTRFAAAPAVGGWGGWGSLGGGVHAASTTAARRPSTATQTFGRAHRAGRRAGLGRGARNRRIPSYRRARSVLETHSTPERQSDQTESSPPVRSRPICTVRVVWDGTPAADHRDETHR